MNKYVILLFFVLVTFLLFYQNHSISIWDQDEGAYALFAKNMIESGNWVIPEAMWSEIHRKPPFHFWCIALSFKLFGIHEFALRIPSVFFTLLNFLLLFFAGRKLFNEKIAFTACVILGTSVLVPLFAKIALVDATLLFFQTLCAFAVIFVLKEKSKRWVFLFWLGFALGILSKGPPIVIFTFIFIGILFLFHPNRKNLLALHPWFFLPIALIPFAYWAYASYLQDGGVFLSWMYDWYILKRISGSVLGQTGPPGTHLLILLACFFPYFLFIPSTIKQTVQDFFKDKAFTLIVGAWFFAGWFFYELSPSKLPSYVLAAHVPFALLLAKQMQSNLKPSILTQFAHYTLQSILAVTFFATPFLFTFPFTIKIALFVCGGMVMAGILFHLWFSKKHYTNAMLWYGIGFQCMVILVVLPQIDGFKNSTKQVATYIKNTYSEEHAIVIANTQWKPPSLPFYLSEKYDTIKEQTFFMDLVYAYYTTKQPCVLILNKKQYELMDRVLGGVEPMYFHNLELTPTLSNGYYVVKKTHKNLPIPRVDAPQPSLELAEYKRQLVESSEDNLRALNDKAKSFNITLEEMIERDAEWMYRLKTTVYRFEKEMRKNASWMALIKKKQKENQSLEDACDEFALELYHLGFI